MARINGDKKVQIVGAVDEGIVLATNAIRLDKSLKTLIALRPQKIVDRYPFRNDLDSWGQQGYVWTSVTFLLGIIDCHVFRGSRGGRQHRNCFRRNDALSHGIAWRFQECNKCLPKSGHFSVDSSLTSDLANRPASAGKGLDNCLSFAGVGTRVSFDQTVN